MKDSLLEGTHVAPPQGSVKLNRTLVLNQKLSTTRKFNPLLRNRYSLALTSLCIVTIFIAEVTFSMEEFFRLILSLAVSLTIPLLAHSYFFFYFQRKAYRALFAESLDVSHLKPALQQRVNGMSNKIIDLPLELSNTLRETWRAVVEDVKCLREYPDDETLLASVEHRAEAVDDVYAQHGRVENELKMQQRRDSLAHIHSYMAQRDEYEMEYLRQAAESLRAGYDAITINAARKEQAERNLG